MKKKIILAVIIVTVATLLVLLIQGGNCTNDGDDNRFNFKSKNEIMSYFDHYAISIEVTTAANLKTNYEFLENNNYIYYGSSKDSYLIDKTNNDVYNVDHVKGLKTKTDDTLVTASQIRNSLLSYMAAHLEIKQADFTLLDQQSELLDVKCNVYESKLTYESYSSTEQYYVSKDHNFCLKRYFDSTTTNTKIAIGWEVKSLTKDETLINESLSKYLNYIEGVGYQEFDHWPSTTLSSLIPVYDKGVLKVATDDGEMFYAYIEGASLDEVRIYSIQLKGHNFKECAYASNESNQHTYITYNDDNVLVKLKYNDSSKVLSIAVKYCTWDEISEELESLNYENS